MGNENTGVAGGSRRLVGWGALLGLLWAGAACSAAEHARQPLSAAALQDQPVPACLENAPIDLASQVGEAPLAVYVNDLRLGYARGGAIYLSRPLCELYGWPLCRFVELHEQAHLHMKTVGAKSTCAETLADCWAAMRSDSDALQAAESYFQGRYEEQTGYHADADVRLQVIRHCANMGATMRANMGANMGAKQLSAAPPLDGHG